MEEDKEDFKKFLRSSKNTYYHVKNWRFGNTHDIFSEIKMSDIDQEEYLRS